MIDDVALSILRDRLVRQAQIALEAPTTPIRFTAHEDANLLLNDLHDHPHAFVLACLMDRQIRTERVWLIPYELRKRLGRFDFPYLAHQTTQTFVDAMIHPTPLHKFPNKMGMIAGQAVQRIAAQYAGDAARIWTGSPSSATIVRRLLEFDGAGAKIATMAANILVRDFRIPVSDKYSIDMSVDVHVRRVFARLGFVDSPEREELIYIYRARELWPEYPGIFDLALWTIGRTVCHPVLPACHACSLSDLCRFSTSQH
jgi:endonuclease III